MRFTFRMTVADGEYLAPTALTKMVSREVPVQLLDGSTRIGHVVAVAVDGDGRSGDVTVELDADPADVAAW